jgi:hypothetical protein
MSTHSIHMRYSFALCIAGCVGVLAGTAPRESPNTFLVWVTVWGISATLLGYYCNKLPQYAKGLIIAAALVRIAFLFSDPILSDDLFRYLWEGKVQLNGLNPFVHSPNSDQLITLRDQVWSEVGHKDVATVYPPGSLAMFRFFAATTYSPFIVKLTAATADLITVTMIYLGTRKRGLAATAIWALHPLPILESAQNGHIEATALMLTASSLYMIQKGTPIKAWALAVAGALVKVLPLVLLIPFSRRLKMEQIALGALLTVAAVGAAFAPWIDPSLMSGFNRYYEAWSFNSSGFNILLAISGEQELARIIGVTIGALIVVTAALRKLPPAMFFLYVSATLIALSPVVHPWYILWALLPALWVGAWPWTVLATTCLWSYHVLGTYDPISATWTEAWWIPIIEYTVPLIATLFWLRARKRRSEE